MKQFSLVAVGGTFDHFHAGHKSLLDKAFSISDEVIIGLTSDIFVRHKTFSSQIQPYSMRKKTLLKYIQASYPKRTFSVVELNDVYGPTIDNGKIQALVVGPKTVAGASQINKTRVKRGLSRLSIVKADYIKSSDGRYISSTRIRCGEISRTGEIYFQLFSQDIIPSSHFRSYLEKVHGKIIRNIDDFQQLFETTQVEKIVWVGDSVGRFFVENQLAFNLGIFDNKVQRVEDKSLSILLKNQKVLSVYNQPGKVSSSMVAKITKILKDDDGKKYIRVFGEEDLAAVPLVLLLPLGSVIFYGLRDMGIIMIEVSEQKKEEVKEFVIKSMTEGDSR